MNVIEIFNVLVKTTPMSSEEWNRELQEHRMELKDGVVVRGRTYHDNRAPEEFIHRQSQDYISGQKIQAQAHLFQSSVPFQSALEIFDHLSAMDLDFGTSLCESRAHVMCAELFDFKVIAGKAWAVPGSGAGNTIHVTRLDGRESNWDYHVAPVLDVVMPGNKIEKLILDPALFNGPVRIDEWAGVMKADHNHVAFVRYGQEPEFKGAEWFGDFEKNVMTTPQTDHEVVSYMIKHEVPGRLRYQAFPSSLSRDANQSFAKSEKAAESLPMEKNPYFAPSQKVQRLVLAI
jgi:hypothetical protein